MVLTAVFVSCVSERQIAVSELPLPAQKFIKSHFHYTKVFLANVEQRVFCKYYKVYFFGGARAEFDNTGNWEIVTCKFEDVPPAIVPVPIKVYAQKNYPKYYIIKINRKNKEYKIEFNNGIGLKFDKDCNLIASEN